MGGRGSSGGGYALSAKMPTLSGSAKQVPWAESIRREALSNVDSLVKTAKSEFGLSLPQGGSVSKKTADFVKKDVVSAFQKITSASKIIDARNNFGYESMRRRMISAQLAVNRGDLKL